MPAPIPSLQPASAQQIPDGLHAPSTSTEHAIVEHKSKIAITRNDVHFFSNFQICFRIECDRGMFRGETDDRAIWVISENRRSFVLTD